MFMFIAKLQYPTIVPYFCYSTMAVQYRKQERPHAEHLANIISGSDCAEYCRVQLVAVIDSCTDYRWRTAPK